jgi:hypothetical protein
MPTHTSKSPAWFAYADILIDNLRKHHGLEPYASDDETAPSDLDVLFAKIEDTAPKERFSKGTNFPSRYVPARKLFTVIKLAAVFGARAKEDESVQCGALTVINGVSVEDLHMVKETLEESFPAHWHIIAPELSDGTFAKNAQRRFDTFVSESVDRIEPVLILQVDGIALPAHLKAIAPTTLTMPRATHDIVLKVLETGNLSDHAVNTPNLRAALPSEQSLARLTTLEVCAALRAPTLNQAVARLGHMSQGDIHSDGPRLEDMTDETAALITARRIVADLQDWQAGKAAWHELSHSLLLYGAPGTGKTWLARAMSKSAGLNLVTGSFGAWQAAGHLGDMLREMRATFAEACRKTPCLLVIDEIDAVGARRDSDQTASHYRVQVITTFLAEMDQIAQQEGIIVVGTCNHIDSMDPTVLRAGRMDVKVEVPMPDAEAIYEILRHHLSTDIADHALQNLSNRAVGRSAADLDAAIRAARSTAQHTRKLLNVEMLEAQMNLGRDTENSARTWRIAVHEAGHAVIAAALNLGTIDRMMITDDGGQIYRQGRPNESRLCDIEDEIAYSLGGRAAERLMLGEISAGAGGPATSDLASATRHAIYIEATYGLGVEGPVWHASPDDAHRSTPAIRDRVRQRLTRAESRTGEILKQNQCLLKHRACQLAKTRSLRAGEIAKILDGITSNTSAPTTKPKP